MASVANPDATPILSAPAVGAVIAVITEIVAVEGRKAEAGTVAAGEISASAVAPVSESAPPPPRPAHRPPPCQSRHRRPPPRRHLWRGRYGRSRRRQEREPPRRSQL